MIDWSGGKPDSLIAASECVQGVYQLKESAASDRITALTFTYLITLNLSGIEVLTFTVGPTGSTYSIFIYHFNFL